MSVWHCLVTVAPMHTPTGIPYPVYAASASDRNITGLGGEVWMPALLQAPDLALALFQGDFSEAVKPAAARIPLQMETLKKQYPRADECYWGGAEVVIYAGRSGDAWPWATVFKGKVSTADRAKQVLTLGADVATEPFDADQLPLTYTGLGDAEGGSDIKGKVKPLVIGHALSVEPVLINATDSVYQFHGYGAIEQVVSLYERGSDFGSEVGDYADYAALVAATIPPGRWATCLAEGLVRLGAPQAGVITGDVRGHAVDGATPELTGAIISALAGIAGVDPGLVETDTLDALDDAVPYPVNFVLQEQASFADTARRIALPCNAQAGVSLTGEFFVSRIVLGNPASLTLDAQGRASPQVLDATENKVSPPYARMIFGANRCWRVHTPDEIAFEASLVDRGLYDDAETYREGNIVWLADKSSWLYINPVPSAGNDPPAWPTTSNAYWQNLTPPGTASDFTYGDGTPIEDLQPAESGSDITSNIPQVADTIVQCDYTWTPKAGQINPRYVQFTLIRNGVDETENASWAATLLSGDLTFAMSNSAGTKGRLNLTAAAADGSIEIEATFGDRVVTVEHKVRRQRDSAPSSGGGGSGSAGSASGSINASVSGTTPAPIGDELEVTIGSGGDVALSAAYEFTSDQVAGSQSADTQWYKWNGSAYVALDSPVHSTTNYIAAGGGEPGHGGCNYTDTGNTASTVQKYRLYGAAGGSYIDYFAGTCSAVAD